MRVTDWQGNTERITRTDSYRHKYADAITEYVYRDMESWADTSTGDAESPTGWFGKAGAKRIIRGDERGFVWTERFDSERDRDTVYDALDAVYWAWSDDELSDDERDELIVKGERYAVYVYACLAEQCNPLDINRWDMHGKPRGPIGTVGEVS